MLEEIKGGEAVLGFAGQFWKPGGGMARLQGPEEFIKYHPADCCKAAWNIKVDNGDGKSVILTTETRVYCPNKAVRRRFAAYWLLIRPFSGLIRIIMLRMIKKKAELIEPPPAK